MPLWPKDNFDLKAIENHQIQKRAFCPYLPKSKACISSEKAVLASSVLKPLIHTEGVSTSDVNVCRNKQY